MKRQRGRLLEDALLATSSLRARLRAGGQAIKAPDMALVAESERPRVGDSLDLDEASREEHPQANRWDYLLSIPDAGRLVGLEPHRAEDGEITVVIAKKRHAEAYLADHLSAGRRVASWFWVTRSAVRFLVMEKARRRLDQAGITFVGRRLRSFDE